MAGNRGLGLIGCLIIPLLCGMDQPEELGHDLSLRPKINNRYFWENEEDSEKDRDEVSVRLMRACAEPDMSQLYSLLSQGADFSVKTSQGFTPLMIASAYANWEAVLVARLGGCHDALDAHLVAGRYRPILDSVLVQNSLTISLQKHIDLVAHKKELQAFYRKRLDQLRLQKKQCTTHELFVLAALGDFMPRDKYIVGAIMKVHSGMIRDIAYIIRDYCDDTALNPIFKPGVLRRQLEVLLPKEPVT